MKHLHKFTHTFSSNFYAAASQNYTQSIASDAPPLDNKFQISKTYKQFIKASIWMGGILALLLPASVEVLGQTSLNSALVVNALAERSIASAGEGRQSEPTTCNNITNGGAIGSNQTITSGGTPTTLTNITTPSGGSGTIEYLWLKYYRTLPAHWRCFMAEYFQQQYFDVFPGASNAKHLLFALFTSFRMYRIRRGIQFGYHHG